MTGNVHIEKADLAILEQAVEVLRRLRDNCGCDDVSLEIPTQPRFPQIRLEGNGEVVNPTYEADECGKHWTHRNFSFFPSDIHCALWRYCDLEGE